MTPAILSVVPRRRPQDNKYTAGAVLVAGGSPGMTGAVCLAAEAAFRADAGYVAVAVPERSLAVVEARLLEPVKVTWADALRGGGEGGRARDRPRARPRAGGAAPPRRAAGGGRAARRAGRGRPARARAGRLGRPRRPDSHAGELARLLGEESAWVNAHRLEAAQRGAERFGAVCLLKGADTIVAAPGEGALVCVTDAPGLATAGTGDVLTGILAAFLAKGVEPRLGGCGCRHGARARGPQPAAGRAGRERRDRRAPVRSWPDGRRHRRVLLHRSRDRRGAAPPRPAGANLVPPGRTGRSSRASGSSAPSSSSATSARSGRRSRARRRSTTPTGSASPTARPRSTARSRTRAFSCGPLVEAGVRRVVHVSVTNPSRDSPLPYFRGKAQVEDDVRASGLLWAIVRPTLVFGPRDILVNNIAWALRRTPVFPVAGDGSYRVQPVSVEDVASICADAGESDGDVVVDAAASETAHLRGARPARCAAIGSRARIVHLPPGPCLRWRGHRARSAGTCSSPRRSWRACRRSCSCRPSRRSARRASAPGSPRTASTWAGATSPSWRGTSVRTIPL